MASLTASWSRAAETAAMLTAPAGGRQGVYDLLGLYEVLLHLRVLVGYASDRSDSLGEFVEIELHFLPDLMNE